MKRFILSAALIVMSLCFSEVASADNFGVLGGANFCNSSVKELNRKTVTRWHAGVVYKVDLPVGFQLQPAVLYNVKAADLPSLSAGNLSVGYLELMASVQWGLDLILFRPFVDVSPYVGYGLASSGAAADLWNAAGNKFEYGIGVGGGLQIWRIQVAARYNWNLGQAFKSASAADVLRNANFNGVTLSVGYFF